MCMTYINILEYSSISENVCILQLQERICKMSWHELSFSIAFIEIACQLGGLPPAPSCDQFLGNAGVLKLYFIAPLYLSLTYFQSSLPLRSDCGLSALENCKNQPIPKSAILSPARTLLCVFILNVTFKELLINSRFFLKASEINNNLVYANQLIFWLRNFLIQCFWVTVTVWSVRRFNKQFLFVFAKALLASRIPSQVCPEGNLGLKETSALESESQLPSHLATY